ncbi:MAG: VapC toxin family PIN domain ribonuclease [Acidobacteria bacterium]|nr:VapC toxin family PIN domain ribonuclease [Acidobacteriota bacterium]
MILLDTDVMVDLLRGYPPAVAWVQSLRTEHFTLPGYVVLELLQGCSNQKETDHLLNAIAKYRVIWPTARDYSRALADFAVARLKQKIGILDVLIGECAVGLNLPLHTFNVKHFAPIPGLRTVQPYAKKTR